MVGWWVCVLGAGVGGKMVWWRSEFSLFSAERKSGKRCVGEYPRSRRRV